MVSKPVSAAEIDGTVFEEEHRYKDVQMTLKGTAMLRYMRFIKAYAGALYLQEDTVSHDALNDVPKRLVLEYRYAISAEDFADATTDIIKRNVDEPMFRRLESRVQDLNDMYRNVQPNDRYSLIYIPGHGTELILNDVPLGVIPGADFARAVFSIWIGNTPIDESFRDRLLGI
jgi:Chalcone isomerase-like